MPGMGRAYPLAQSWFRRRIPERKAYDKLHTLREGLDVYYLYRSGRQLRLRGGSGVKRTSTPGQLHSNGARSEASSYY